MTRRDQSGEVRSRLTMRAGVGVLAYTVSLFSIGLAGCNDSKFLSQTCPQPQDLQLAADAPAPNAAYRLGCPDVLEVSFLDHPSWDVLVSIDVDGRLPLEHPGNPRVEGLTLDEVRVELARMASVPAEHVIVQLAAARNSRIFLHGPIRGRTRIVPYQGPEPVIDFLKRVGGLPPGSKLSEVYVVRPNVAVGERPEIFRVNVPKVLLHNDQATNVRLMPDDQVYVGETKGSIFARLLPDWLAPIYRRFVGLTPDDWWVRNKFLSQGP